MVHKALLPDRIECYKKFSRPQYILGRMRTMQKMLTAKTGKRRAFTLVEVLIVLILIGILTGSSRDRS